MNSKKKIFYWSPFLVPIATPRAVVNSAYAMKKFSKNNNCHIINFFGEFNSFKEELNEYKIDIVNYFNNTFIKLLPKYGKIKSRFSFILIFIFSFFPLKKLLTREKPDYLVIHLITSLPLILLLIFNFKTKFILRISGLPKLNIFRKFLWTIAFKKIHLITCPTINTMNYMRNLNIVSPEKIQLLYDPIINIKEIKNKKLLGNKLPKFENKKYFLAAGRLTKQKNFLFLCKAFKEILPRYPEVNLLIAGDGEEKEKIKKYINENNLQNKIFLLGFTKNIFYYLKNSEGFILSSLWEDPGFVLVEAAFSRTPILSSDCENGPKELVKDNLNGILFETNSVKDFKKKFELFVETKRLSNKLALNGLKMSKKFTLFSHYSKFNQLI